MSVEHYENFPVASWLCPAALRPPITAIYHFARTADDLADEGQMPAEERRRLLAQYREALHRALLRDEAPQGRWAEVFGPLQREHRRWAFPLPLLEALLDAFVQDCGNPLHPDRDSLRAYCRRSADPIGRLLLHLYGIDDPKALEASDAVCTALQLINFWQDLSVDLPRGRCYLPQDALAAAGLPPRPWPAPPDAVAGPLVTDLLDWAEAQMRLGAPLVHRLPGRVGWELRLVVQGGLRIVEKLRQAGPARAFLQRPTLTALDGPRLLWRAFRMHA